MSLGDKENVVHYGVSGNPHAISLSRKRLKEAFIFKKPPLTLKPILHYQPSDDVTLIQMQLTLDGLLFQPVFDYRVEKR